MEQTVFPLMNFAGGSKYCVSLAWATNIRAFLSCTALDTVRHFEGAANSKLRARVMRYARTIFHPHDPDWIPWTAPLYPSTTYDVAPASSQPQIGDRAASKDQLRQDAKMLIYARESLKTMVARRKLISDEFQKLEATLSSILNTVMKSGLGGWTVKGSDLDNDQRTALRKCPKRRLKGHRKGENSSGEEDNDDPDEDVYVVSDYVRFSYNTLREVRAIALCIPAILTSANTLGTGTSDLSLHHLSSPTGSVWERLG